MKFIAIQECPQGQQPGDVFEATEDAGNVLVLVGAAKVYSEPEPEPVRRGRYRRSDMRAEAESDPTVEA